jgi:superfamily II DNA/RNA helicase
MNIYQLHQEIMADYKAYIGSFVNIKNEDIRKVVEDEIEQGKLWRQPLIQFNPSFKIGQSTKSLIELEGIHPSIGDLLDGYPLHFHQVEALKQGARNNNFIVSSGTGSGKSLTYIASIFNSIFKEKDKKKGIKAIIVYPMNALINSQYEELEKYKENYQRAAKKDCTILFAKYTGQESREERIRIQTEEPDILLTNYMMLELILTRSGNEKVLRESIYEHLQFLVYDELHTFRGRQGADVALLNRRIRARCKHTFTCIGTSATLISDGTRQQQKEKISEVATSFFGSPFEADQVILESLDSSIVNASNPYSKSDLISAITTAINVRADSQELVHHPLIYWLETNIALQQKETIWERRKPMSLADIAALLNIETGLPCINCLEYLIHFLEWLGQVNIQLHSQNKPTILPFKFHQFISQTGSVYLTLDNNDSKIITLEASHFKIIGEQKKPLYPVVFSRESGHEFICVTKDASKKLYPREFTDWHSSEEEVSDGIQRGYLVIGKDVWNPTVDLDYLPDSWVKRNKANNITGIIPKYKDRIPQRIFFNEFGNWSDEPTESCTQEGWFMPYKLLFDPTSATFYDTKTSESTKLSRLGSEGRSTSTTVLTFSILRQMALANYPENKQKVLSFTDNRQDAALQAGHFNDYIDTIKIRSGIFQAINNSDNGELNFANLGDAVFNSLLLPQSEYAQSPATFAGPKTENEKAIKTYITYRALEDLKRSWRVILPNLEQCALLELNYKWIEENAIDNDGWHLVPIMEHMNPLDRSEFILQILDYFRKSYAIRSEEYLTEEKVELNKSIIRQKLKDPWRFEEDEKLFSGYYLIYAPVKSREKFYTASIGSNSAFGKYVKKVYHANYEERLNKQQYREVIENLMHAFSRAGWLYRKQYKDADGNDAFMYQLNVECILWHRPGGDTIREDKIRNPSGKREAKKGNAFFASVYQTDYSRMKKLKAQDHTGQLSNQDRQEREALFREGKELSALYCSPTMELGIDISSLDIVHMRNVPPNPANYAQRSGRAGRSGQAALVFTYCSSYSPHDRNYFRNAIQMVAGSVVPPTLDLYNEEMLRAHLHAIYFSELGLEELNNSINDLLDETKLHEPNIVFNPLIAEKIDVKDAFINKIKLIFENILQQLDCQKLRDKSWYTDSWLSITISQFNVHLAEALKRWRKLYFDAIDLRNRATAEIESGLIPANHPDFKNAQARQKQAQRQIDLLKNIDHTDRSEFYPYRYLAAEGFLPGYNFTRLPIRTFVQNDVGEYISRPGPIAIREFGPMNLIYHNGNKFSIEQLQLPDLENNLFKGKVSTKSGYFLSSHTGEYDNELCPFTGESLDNDNNRKIFAQLLEMSESRAKRKDRITCEEEERSGQGFRVDTYFNVPAGLQTIQKSFVSTPDGEDLFKINYIPTAALIHINRGWRNIKKEGFKINKQYGFWKPHSYEKSPDSTEQIIEVMLYTAGNTDAVYLQPLKSLCLTSEGITSLMYAIKRAVEIRYQVEAREIGAVLMGDRENPNIMLYEAAEGSLGILSQLLNPTELNKLAEIAYNLCRYNDSDYKDPASYDDLLSYFNQRDHAAIDRFLIKETLLKLKKALVTRLHNNQYADYNAHYQSMLSQYDHTSELERNFLEYLYQNGYRLPDKAQTDVDGIYSRPDFFYKPDCHVFVDGSVHDDPEQKEHDRRVREAILNNGEQVLVYHYTDNIEQKIKERPDIFQKVR